MTLYYNNDNYGGIAQAYALNKYFNDIGYDSELISYDKKKSELNLNIKRKKTIRLIFNSAINRAIFRPLETISKKINGKKYIKLLEERHKKLECFRNEISHSVVYNNENINMIKDKYDYYISGSDQIWNPGVVDDNFVFNFLDSSYNIFSYAPSVAVEKFSDKYINFMTNSLNKYSNLSLREESSTNLLTKKIDRKIEWVVDPTMLLDKSDWNDISSDRLVNEKYIFSYILGDSISQRRKVEKFAKKLGLKLVTIPFIKKGNKFEYRMVDNNFGDIKMLNISFEDFLSLIKYSEYVVTDSFHAVSFSYIFEKEFFVIDRGNGISTNSRIDSILKILKLENRFIHTKEIPINFDKIDYDVVNESAKDRILISKKYIENSLKMEDSKK